MRIAFYAPMKSPDAGSPSGDRTIARLLLKALDRAVAPSGGNVLVASTLRTWSSSPDASVLSALEDASRQEVDRLTTLFRDVRGQRWQPDLWFTYHNYYRAPDLVGPRVAAALGIPYLVAEGSYAVRRAEDDWSPWLGHARRGLEAASGVLCFTERDKRGLLPIVSADRLIDLPPFLDMDALPGPADREGRGAPVRLVAVAMMRTGAKTRSYRFLASALGGLSTDALASGGWHLDVVGDGPMRAEIEAGFSALPGAQVTFHGQLDARGTHRVLAAGDIFVWPGFDEAFGMAYLEAQAMGLPAVALATAGVPEIVTDGITGILTSPERPAEFTEALARLISEPLQRRRLGMSARHRAVCQHSLDGAARTLRRVLDRLVRHRQG